MLGLEILSLPLIQQLLLELLKVSSVLLTALFCSLVSGLFPPHIYRLPVCEELYLEGNNDIMSMYFHPVNADVVLKGTNVNGIYDCHSGNGNVALEHISFREAVSSNFTTMDTMALTYCEENGIPGWYFVLS